MWYTVRMNNLKLTFAAASVALACTVSVRASAETLSLNADWRFTKAPKTIPLSQAKASVETAGVKVEDPAFDDSSWEAVSVPHPINAHDSFDDRAVDAGEASFWRGMAFYRKRFALDAARRRTRLSRRCAGRTPTSTDASRSARTAARPDASTP